jgi:hypothetical protein
MPKTATVYLGGKEYVLQAKPIGPHRIWRKRLEDSNVVKIFKTLDETLIQLVAAGDAIQEAWQSAKATKEDGDADSNGDGINFSKIVEVARILPVVINGLLGSIDEIHDLLFHYDAKLQTERNWIEAHAYDEEAIEAFIQVLKLNFPITALWGLVSGSKAHSTPSNSHATNGASGLLPPDGPRKKVVA